MGELTDLLGAAMAGSPELQGNAKRFADARPKPDPKADLKAEYATIRGNYMLELFRDGSRDAPPPPYEKWRDEKLAPAKERAQAEAEAATAKKAVAEGQAEMKRLEKELKSAEVRDRGERLNAASARIAADRRARGKRVLEPGELRSRAARELAELDVARRKLEGA